MRCLNCGWDNVGDTGYCLKCGQQLARASSPAEPAMGSGRITKVSNNAIPEEQQARMPKPTVRNIEVVESQHRATMLHASPMQAAEQPKAAPGVCTHCGYPVAPGSTTCPCCGTPIAQSSAPAPQPIPPTPAPTPSPSPTAATSVPPTTSGRSTIRVSFAELEAQLGVQEPPKPHFRLTPMTNDDQLQTDHQMDYEGDEVILNRDNTDPGNRTITSREQAVLNYSDGHWVIDNRSDLKTTFLQVERPLVLQPGDVIVLGNRRFRFEEEAQ